MPVMKNLKFKKFLFAFFLIFSLNFTFALLLSDGIAENNELFVSATFSLERIEQEEIVSIIIGGRVTDTLNKSISNVAISIQVVDPFGSTNHIALSHSKSDGSFIDQFLLKGDFLPGNYTIYLTASKIGYSDTHLQIPFTIILFDFLLSVDPKDQIVEQGGSVSFEIIAAPTQNEKNFSISFSLADLAPVSKIRPFFLRNASDAHETRTILFLNTTKDTPQGTYNMAIVAQGGGKKHTVPIVLRVTRERLPTDGEVWDDYTILIWAIPLIFILIVIIFLSYLMKKGKIISRRVDKKFEPREDDEYIKIARALAKLDELRSKNEIDEVTYLTKKREYQKKLKDWE